MYKTLFLLFLLPLQLFALDLKQEVTKAQSGDFIVYAYKQSLVLLRIRENSPPHLVVEEISAPLSAVSGEWQAWVSKEAPGHTSWTISRINLVTGRVDSIFSVDEKKFMDSNPAFQFLPTLLQLTLNPIDPADRKLVGPTPLAGEQDMRRLWLPKIIFEHKELFPKVLAAQVLWPKDESELSGKPIDLYLPEGAALGYLPYWIEVSGGLQKAKISALDSGRNLSSPISLHTYEQEEK